MSDSVEIRAYRKINSRTTKLNWNYTQTKQKKNLCIFLFIWDNFKTNTTMVCIWKMYLNVLLHAEMIDLLWAEIGMVLLLFSAWTVHQSWWINVRFFFPRKVQQNNMSWAFTRYWNHLWMHLQSTQSRLQYTAVQYTHPLSTTTRIQ